MLYYEINVILFVGFFVSDIIKDITIVQNIFLQQRFIKNVITYWSQKFENVKYQRVSNTKPMDVI